MDRADHACKSHNDLGVSPKSFAAAYLATRRRSWDTVEAGGGLWCKQMVTVASRDQVGLADIGWDKYALLEPS